MPERPLIVLPAPAVASRSRLFGGGTPPHLPGITRQGQRLGPRFDALKNYFEQRALHFRGSAAGQVPEEVIVFETIGSVADFLKATKRIPGFDFMAELDVEDIAPDEDFYDEKRSEKSLSGRVFLVMSNGNALLQLLSLWQSFRNAKEPARGFAPFRELFKRLRDVRRWSTEDRLMETNVLKSWKEAADLGDASLVPFEIELWFRHEVRQRAISLERITSIINGLRGQIVSVFELEPICYQNVLVTLPASQIRRLVSGEEVNLLGDSAVRYFRPSGQMVFPINVGREFQEPTSRTANTMPQGESVVALLDGLPLENHVRLAGRLRIDDPDGFASAYVANEREHGTAMASIILHGDLNAPRQPLQRPLYVRPILRPDPQPWNSTRHERIPHSVNALDITHRAVKRLFESEGISPPASPATKIINFSIGDPLQQFSSTVSAWGRLLDWLATKYNVLFIVSAGNHSGEIVLDVARDQFRSLSSAECEKEFVKVIYRDMRLRRIIAPSDSINSITVGAWHHDFGQAKTPANRVNPLLMNHLPSPLSGLGCGFRNATKPDILMPGGRQLFTERYGNTHSNATFDVSHATVSPGILSATPSSTPGHLDKEAYTRGTSNATAFASRSAAFLYDQLVSLRSEVDGERISDDYAPVLLKAMLVHRASWGPAYDHLKTVLKPKDMREDKFKRVASRFLGYGFVEPFESLLGADHRATMIGCGGLTDGAAHIYRIPLPPSLNSIRGLRRIIVTLAWLTPIYPRHRNYRSAALWFEIEKEKLAAIREDTDWHSARNGTVQHEVFEGERAAPFAENDTMELRVNCRADASPLEHEIRYGLIISIEVAEELGIPVYNEIAALVRTPVSVKAQIV